MTAQEPNTNRKAKRRQECQDYYKRLQERTATIMDETFADDQGGLHSSRYSFVLDLEKWLDVLEQRPEIQVYKIAIREYQYSLFAAVSGLYRQAFMSLRLFLEMVAFGIDCSANELKLRRWMRGEVDVHWLKLSDSDSGILSSNFTRAFFEELDELAPQYATIARTIYRECSEYVHGNYSTQQGLTTLEFDHDLFLKWENRADSAKLVVSFLFCIRYLKSLDETQKNTLEMAIIDSVGHIAQIRSIIGGPTEV